MPESKLLWQPVFSLSRKPAKKSIPRRNRHAAKGNTPQEYEFVCEYPISESVSSGQEPTGSSRRTVEVTANLGTNDHQTRPSSELSQDPEETDWPSGSVIAWSSNGNSLAQDSDDTLLQETENTANAHRDPAQAATILPDSGELAYTGHHDYHTLTPSRILYNTIFQRFEPILTRYNKEFCKIPLTSDLQINPFQYRKGSKSEPPFLVHAVMALAGHHVGSPDIEHHHRTALKLLRESVNTWCNIPDVYHMLDTIIILFSLDETRSTLGNWAIHLTGAFALLEASGGTRNWTQSPRAVVQVGLLTWWDAITSLLSREDCVFPYSYFEACISRHGEKGWDYFSLCGCPLQLVKIVMQLARLSAERRKSSSMQYVKFDDAIVSEIEKLLECWQHESSPTSLQDEASMHQDLDNMHCSEAWRNGLLLYLYRVFQWEPGSRVSISAPLHARKIADHVFACREDSLVAKQALLPLFFAGCELRDESTRRKILRYCTLWDDMTRYHMFNSTIPLLREIWAEQERKGFDDVWWGQVVDRAHLTESRGTLKMRLCFG
ncbi:fungal-specific transcription factor domain-containing protein [Xylaria sp. FL0064]|nr:fungal-specific transcription factor domain-containing protein [Xylaria sp. FL0064]